MRLSSKSYFGLGFKNINCIENLLELLSANGFLVQVILRGNDKNMNSCPIERPKIHPDLELMAQKKLLVIGDLVLDQYIWGDVNRISPEAPVPVVEVQKETFRLGGAANVACNIASLSGQVEVVGLVGADENGEKLISLLQEQSVTTSAVGVDNSRPTSTKTRIIAGNQQIVRIDKESTQYSVQPLHSQLLSVILEKVDTVDAVIFADYDKGVVNSELIRAVTSKTKLNRIPVTVDPKVENFWSYEGVTSITPNQKEASIAVGIRILDQKTLLKVGQKILERLDLAHLLITRGEHGMSLFEKTSEGQLKVQHIETKAQDVFDVTGAGDTVIAVFTMALSAGLTPFQAAQMANMAGGIVVTEVGCVAVDRKKLNRFWEE